MSTFHAKHRPSAHWKAILLAGLGLGLLSMAQGAYFWWRAENGMYGSPAVSASRTLNAERLEKVLDAFDAKAILHERIKGEGTRFVDPSL